jgi:replicative DNA helicase
MQSTSVKHIYNILSNLTDDESIIHQLKKVIEEFDEANDATQVSKSIESLLNDAIHAIQYQKVDDNLIKTPFNSLNNVLGGFSLGEMIVIGGRPSMGKTQLLINLATHISQSYPTLFISYDLSEHLLTYRILSLITNLETDYLLRHNISDEEKSLLSKYKSEGFNHRLFINDGRSNSITELKRYCINQIKEKGVKVIMIDYLQLIRNNRKNQNKDAEISYICRELKSLAAEHHVCIIITSQLSRALENRGGDKRPQLSDLRDSGAIEQDADKVLLLYRPIYYGFEFDEDNMPTKNIMKVLIAKNRMGGLGEIALSHNSSFSVLTDHVLQIDSFNFSSSRLDEIDTKGDNPF